MLILSTTVFFLLYHEIKTSLVPVGTKQMNERTHMLLLPLCPMVIRFPNKDSLLGPEIEPADAMSRASGLDNYGIVGLQRQIMEGKLFGVRVFDDWCSEDILLWKLFGASRWKELDHAARYLANQEWVKSDSLKIVENTAVPIIMLLVEVPHDLITPAVSTISTLKEEPTEVKELTERFPAATPLALVLKQFLADRSLDQSYSGGLSSYCLEVEEGLGDVRGVDELEDEASAADAELKSGGGVIVETIVGSSLDVEADNEAMELGTMDGCDSKI
ncbi:hypothetical protein TEA_011248 [Camellia sinensis var. sinensis]|uniref:Uncharacterized protein n=1 Tax=Camellia sinensis var. sinensis TaxID=542762 RepID=A0A4S4CZP0_CAMSN|nr:hypothetical protein TEA_011248 [Camellia sinensis var. sinensis]